MGALRMEMVLTGPLTGKSVVVNRHNFVNGVGHIIVEPHAMDAFLVSMARSCQAYPQGSDELAYAQQRDRASGLLRDIQANPASPDGAPAPVQSAGKRDASGQVPDPRALQCDEHAGSATGSEGLVPGGTGHEDAGLGDRVESGANEQSVAVIGRIRKVVEKLDPKLDDHWTSDGLPSVSVIADALSDQKVTREMIDSAVPEWNREKAEDAAEL